MKKRWNTFNKHYAPSAYNVSRCSARSEAVRILIYLIIDGAALFFTSHYHPSTFARLRSYVLHRIHASTSLQSSHTPAQTDRTPGSTAPAIVASSSRYPFPYRANAVDREQICIPSGWDSFGKIRVLRDGFDCAATARGWQLDLGATIREEGDEIKAPTSTLSAYESIVTDIETLQNPHASAESYMEVQNEQDFLRAHHDMLVREAAKVRQQQQQLALASGNALPGLQSPYITDMAKKFFGSAGVVGPMASSGLSLPTVERALDMESGNLPVDASSAKRSGLDRRVSREYEKGNQQNLLIVVMHRILHVRQRQFRMQKSFLRPCQVSRLRLRSQIHLLLQVVAHKTKYWQTSSRACLLIGKIRLVKVVPVRQQAERRQIVIV